MPVGHVPVGLLALHLRHENWDSVGAWRVHDPVKGILYHVLATFSGGLSKSNLQRFAFIVQRPLSPALPAGYYRRSLKVDPKQRPAYINLIGSLERNEPGHQDQRRLMEGAWFG